MGKPIDGYEGNRLILTQVSAKALASRHELSYPGETELKRIVKETATEHHRRRKPVRASLDEHELKALVSNLRGLTRRQARQAILDAIALDQRLDVTDIHAILSHKKRTLAAGGLLEYVEAPTSMDETATLGDKQDATPSGTPPPTLRPNFPRPQAGRLRKNVGAHATRHVGSPG